MLKKMFEVVWNDKMIQQMESEAPKLGRDEDQEGTSKMMLET